jgi:CHAD domain-containing protein
VAEARLRVWLDLGGGAVLRNELRRLRRHTTAVRDLDVALEQAPPLEWAARLHAKRTRARAALRLALDQPRLGQVLLALGTLPPVPRRHAERVVARLARKALRRGGGIWKRADPEDLHRLRRAARRLRYALEWAGRGTGPVVELQDALGEACDRVVALRRLASGPGARGAYRARLEGQLQARVKRARRAWRRTKPLLRRLSERSRVG